jgi:hypothetical protein
VSATPSGTAEEPAPTWRVEALADHHDLRGFICGVDFLDKYVNHAKRNQELGYGRTHVALDPHDCVCGYSTIAMGNVYFDHLPENLKRRVPRYPMPAALLCCLAVSLKHQRCGLGKILLMDALSRIVQASEIIAARVVEVFAIDDNAKQWYLKFGFLPFLDHERHLYLPMDTVRTAVKGWNLTQQP